ncbi:MAG: flagellar biosynthesis protein FlhB [Spirochaetaceae bacterium]|nr:flagellar biosynthesis protein FlhB [Spirochaetaceae bacterium]
MKDNELLKNKNLITANKHLSNVCSLKATSGAGWIPLQFFAAEDEGRSEAPTERKLKKSREEGKVAKSQDLGGVLVLIFSLIIIAVMAGWLVRNFAQMMQLVISRAGMVTTASATFDRELGAIFLRYFFLLTMPVFGISFVAAFIGNIMQVGVLFSTKPLKPDFKKIIPNFGRYLKKNVVGVEALFNLGKMITKAALIAFFAFFVLRSSVDRLVATPFTLLTDSAAFIAERAFVLMAMAALVMLVIAIIDFFFQKRQYTENLKMTKRDVKEEMKEDLGNPYIKSRIRQRMIELLSANMIQNVPKADVVVTNPTHFAIAIEYTPGSYAPRVTAKGVDSIALNIRRIAEEHRVPIIENKPLARALYDTVEVGDEIPEEYWEVTITILQKVYQMTGKKVTQSYS